MCIYYGKEGYIYIYIYTDAMDLRAEDAVAMANLRATVSLIVRGVVVLYERVVQAMVMYRIYIYSIYIDENTVVYPVH